MLIPFIQNVEMHLFWADPHETKSEVLSNKAPFNMFMIYK